MAHRSSDIEVPGEHRSAADPSHSGAGHSGHSHSLSGAVVALRPMAARIVVAAIGAAAIAVVIGAVVLWPTHRTHAVPIQFQSAAPGQKLVTVDATVVSQTRAQCLNPAAGAVSDTPVPVAPATDGPCIDSVVSLSSGKDKGAYTLIEVPTNRAQAGNAPGASKQNLTTAQLARPQPGQPDLSTGDGIRLVASPVGGSGQSLYGFYDFQRNSSTLIWVIAFAAAIVLVAAWRGLRSVCGLVVAFAVLLVFTLPAILDGKSPVAVAITSSAAILIVVIYLAHGMSLRSSAALLGTLASLGLAALLSWLSVATMHITGLSQEQTSNLQMYSGNISVSGILLAGFIIGALGVLNDVTITQASAVFELADSPRSKRATFAAAMRVGRDHIASTVYTLVFAYAGSALPLLLLFSVAGQSFTSLITSDTIAVELARACVGGIAIALSVPITTAVAIALLPDQAVRADDVRAP